MNVDKIARLFSAQSEPAQTQTNTATAAAGAENSDDTAVGSLNDQAAQASGNDGDARAAKVASLKQAVADGSYNPSSQQVANSVYQELFV